MEQKRNKTGTELEHRKSPVQSISAPDQTAATRLADLPLPALVDALTTFESCFPSNVNKDGAEGLSQRLVFRTLIRFMKPGPSISVPADSARYQSTSASHKILAIIFYDDILKSLGDFLNTKQMPGEHAALYRRRAIPTIKPHVQRIKTFLQDQAGLDFVGKRDHYRLVPCATSAPNSRLPRLPGPKPPYVGSPNISPWEIIGRIMRHKKRSEVIGDLVRDGLSKQMAKRAIDSFGRMAIKDLENINE